MLKYCRYIIVASRAINMKFNFSPRVSIICGTLALGMVLMAIWQWKRHEEKLQYVAVLSENLSSPIVKVDKLLSPSLSSQEISFRRVSVSGTYDFEHEVVLRNRRVDSEPGVFVLTPLKLKESDTAILVNRGFIPLNLSERKERQVFQKQPQVEFIGIIKETHQKKIFGPEDPPTGPGNPWVDAWLRVDVENISQQIPYKLFPYYVEVMGNDDATSAQKLIVSSNFERDEMFFLAGKHLGPVNHSNEDLSRYPIPTFSTVVPPARHLGYVFEWSAMALMTLIIAVILQLRRPKLTQNELNLQMS